MYAVIRRYRTDPSSIAELIQNVNEGFVPLVREVQGFIAYYVLDAGDGVIATVSIFENRAGIEASNRIAADWIKQNLATFFPESVNGIPLRVEETLQGTLYGVTLESVYVQGPQETKGILSEEAPRSSGDQGSQLLSIEEVSERLGMGKSWLYRRLRSGEIPSLRLGRAIKVKRSDLEEYLENQRYRAPSKE